MNTFEWIKKLNAVPSTKYKGRWDVFGDVYLSGKNLTKLPLQFGIVTGDFDCSDNQLETLEGAPQYVGGDFICNDNKLKTLEGAPQKVGGYFHCGYNELKSLEGAPQKVGGNLYIENNSLEHLNDLLNIKIKGEIVIFDSAFYPFIEALQNTDLHILEYTLSNHKYCFFGDEIEKEFQMHLEQIIIKKRLENLIY